jgi:hypothetical protein
MREIFLGVFVNRVDTLGHWDTARISFTFSRMWCPSLPPT